MYKRQPEDAAKIKAARSNHELAPLATAFDLKEDFFNIYDENPSSKDNAKKAFEQWEQSIPKDAIYDKFRELAATVHRFEDQIFAYWDCPIAISNGYTESVSYTHLDVYKRQPVLRPTDREQEEIISYIKTKCTAIDAAIEKKKKAIEKWEEYKKSLIYYAVTGKIDCRNEVIE